MYFTLALSFLRYTAFPVVTSFVKLIPWQVWIAIGCLLGVLYYGHWKQNRGYEICQEETEKATIEELDRQHEESRKALEEANQRLAEAEQQNETLNSIIEDIQNAARDLPKDNKCKLPASITDRVRKLQ